MASPYWDEALATRYRAFQYSFADRPLAGRVIILAGGTGGLAAAATMLLAQEGAKPVVRFRSNRSRAEALRAAVAGQCGQMISLVEGDVVLPEVRHAYLEAAASLGPLEGGAIFPGDPARVSLESLDAVALRSSWDANFVGPMILAKQFRGVRVNVVAPGATVAGMAEASVSSGKYDAYVSSGAIPRFGRPEDIARAVRFFLEPDGYVTGQVLLADGGLTLRRDLG